MLEQNLRTITKEITKAAKCYATKTNTPPQKVHLIAVSKYHSAQDIHALYTLGQRAFGENKLQDLKAKIQLLSTLPIPPDIEWHFIGSLQKNKINGLLALRPTLIHSIDSLPLAYALNDRCAKIDRIQDVLLQVNAANEASKHGFTIDSAYKAFMDIKQNAPYLNLRGLMSIGAHTTDTQAIHASFATTKSLYDSLMGVDILSMGMSGDFKEAIYHGANMVRIGSALFGTKI